MKKLLTTTNIILFALIIMVLLNIVSMYMLYSTKEQVRGDRPGMERDRREPKYIIIDKLGFSEDQIAAYEELVKEHRNIVKSVRGDIRELKKELYEHLDLPLNDPRVTELLNEISLRNQVLDAATFEHFRKVRALCDEEQKKEFDKIINRILDIMSREKPPHRPPHPPPRRHPGPGGRP